MTCFKWNGLGAFSVRHVVSLTKACYTKRDVLAQRMGTFTAKLKERESRWERKELELGLCCLHIPPRLPSLFLLLSGTLPSSLHPMCHSIGNKAPSPNLPVHVPGKDSYWLCLNHMPISEPIPSPQNKPLWLVSPESCITRAGSITKIRRTGNGCQRPKVIAT